MKKVMYRLAGLIIALLTMVVSTTVSFADTVEISSPSDAINGVVWVKVPLSSTRYGWGTGFAIGDPGAPVEYIVTNAHVVTNDGEFTPGSREIQVYFSYATNDFMIASLYKIDEERDMAVLKLPEPTTKRTALVLCPSDDIRTGESVAAIGYPAVSNDVTYDTKYDLTDVTVTGGVLSKKTTSKNRGNCSVYQTDADINGGNSGGPLVNSKGQVIGINTFYRAYDDAKLNYAICIDELIDLVPQDSVGYVLSTDAADAPKEDPDSEPVITTPEEPEGKNESSPILIIVIIAVAVVAAAAAVIVIVMLKNKAKPTAAPTNAAASAKAAVPVSNSPATPVIICEKGLLAGRSFPIGTTQLRAEDRYPDIFVLRNDLSRISYQPEPVIVPTEDTSEKMPAFQTAVPFGMTQGVTVANPQPAANQPVVNGAAQAAPSQKKTSFAEFYKKHKNIILGGVAALVLIIGGAIAIPNLINTFDKPSYTNRHDDDDSEKPSKTSIIEDDEDSGSAISATEDSVQELNKWAKNVNNEIVNQLTRRETRSQKSPTESAGIITVNSAGTWEQEWFPGDSEKLSTSELNSFGEDISDHLSEVMPDLRNVAFAVSVKDRRVQCVWSFYHKGSLEDARVFANSLYYKLIDDSGNVVSAYEWDGKTAGVTADGIAVGTDPIIGLGSPTAQTASTTAATTKAITTTAATTKATTTTKSTTAAEPEEEPYDEKEMVDELNEVAKGFRENVDYILDTFQSNYSQGRMWGVEKLKIRVDAYGSWSLTGLNSDHFTSFDGYYWSSSVSGVNADVKSTDGDMTKALVQILQQIYPNWKYVSVYAVIQGGKCTFAALSGSDSSDTVFTLANDMVDSSGKIVYAAKWNGKTAGVASNGLCVGTSPVVGLK